MAKARPLVRGYLERVSFKAFRKYHPEIGSLVRAQHGVYALYKKDRLYYVGLASNLRRRVKRHLADKHAGRWDRFSLYLVRKVDHIREIEALLLRISAPGGNRQGGKLRSAINLKKALSRLVSESQRAEREEMFGLRARGRRIEVDLLRRRPGHRSRNTHGQLKGIIGGGKRIYASFKGKEYKALVKRNGRIRFNGSIYDSPTAAAKAITKRAVNGWRFWRIRHNGGFVPIRQLRP